MKIGFLQSIAVKAFRVTAGLFSSSRFIPARNSAFTFQGKLNQSGAPANE